MRPSPRRSTLLPLVATLLPLLGAPLAGCGDDDVGPAADILVRLQELPHVVTVSESPTDTPGYRYFSIEFEQPVDHDHPDGATFIQHLSLLHRADDAPMVLATTGYADWILDNPTEPTALLAANQLSVEQRYFLPSRPVPTDWSFLRVAQAAADHHEIADAFHRIYTAAWVSTGASKGGMTSVYHRRFYPDDVDGTLAYVAPHSIAAGDTRYDPWFDATLPADCLQRLRDFQIDLLKNRRQAMIDRETARVAAEPGTVYGRVALPVAIESATVDVEWAFFQYFGVDYCPDIPGVDADDDTAWSWLAAIGDPSGLSDAQLALFEPYYYQADAELGYPTTEQPHLDGLLLYDEEDYAGADPPGQPITYDPTVLQGVADWVRGDAEAIVFLYGEYDPWTAGAFDLGDNAALARYTVAQGTHGSSLSELPADDRAAAFASLEAWTGVTPIEPPPTSPAQRVRGDAISRLQAQAERVHREPRLSLHALQMAAARRATAP